MSTELLFFSLSIDCAVRIRSLTNLEISLKIPDFACAQKKLPSLNFQVFSIGRKGKHPSFVEHISRRRGNLKCREDFCCPPGCRRGGVPVSPIGEGPA